MTKAAGILFLSRYGNALFLRRTASAPDAPGTWDFPGGGQEGDESAEETAQREAEEEVGEVPAGTRAFHTRTISGSAPLRGVAGPGAPLVGVPVDGGAPAAESPPLVPPVQPEVDFTTFVQRVADEFAPELNDEHDGWAWAPVVAPPQPLHPGCQVALDRLTMDEVGVARAIADGRLASPQRYENVMLWAIRLTGTGASYRPKANEFVYRDADIHLNPDALARWNGAPVIFQHPDEGLLTSEEFSKRVVGTVFLPYVSGDEAWGIAKIWDDDANRLMTEENLSTSPGVNFRDFKVNRVLRLEDGAKVLKEGKPSLVDHVAICQLGVWDKGGEPSGIRSEAREDSAMAEESKAEEKAKEDHAKKDASTGEHPDANLSHVLDAVKSMTDAVTGLTKRMDAFEEKEKERDDAHRKDAEEREDAARKDAEEKEKAEAERLAADKAKKDAAEKEEKEAKEREDAARKDSAAAADVSKRIAAVEKLVQDVGSKVTPISDDDHHLLAEAWSRTDDVCSALGQKTPRAMPGETSMQYRRRVVKQLRQHSPHWGAMKDDEFARAVTDDAAFVVIEGQVMADSAAFARSPATAKPGMLRMIEKRRDGHIIREFVGQPRDWMDPMAGATQLRGTGRFAGLDGRLPN